MMNQNSKNILLISGSGRNVGKTRFICEVISAHATQPLIAIKITPHFHEPTPGLEAIAITENYRIYFETDMSSQKDSALFLKSGAKRVLHIQTSDHFIEEALKIAVSTCDPDMPIIAESAALRKYIAPGMYLFIQHHSGEIKPEAFEMQKLADATIISDGSTFSITPNSIVFNQNWKIDDQP